MMVTDLGDDGDSQEEMDVETLAVHRGNIVNGIRYSARVQEKQEKLRREASPSKQMVADSTSTVGVPVPCQSTSTSIPRLPLGEETTDIYPLETTFLSQALAMSGEKKKKRTWELWSQEDKQLFFEALNEFGKDFDAIQTYLASKLKPRSKGSCSQAVPKNKDQVRHFYYRTWNKISKYLTFPKDMKKAYQELYGLINYGELRKKQRVLNLKTAVKLSELVERGTTTIKVRGKTFRIKTPVCRALKKLNQLEDTDQIRVPCKLCVELIPHDGSTWESVQQVSHNPRVRVYVPLQRTLSSLIRYFEERWKTGRSRLKEEFSLSVFGKPRTRLRFLPVESRDLSVPIFKFSEVTSATKICLSSYVQNCLSQEDKHDSAMVSKKFKRKSKQGLESESGNCSGSINLRDSDYLAAEADVSDADGCEAAPENQFRITLRRDKLHSSGFRPYDFFGEQENSNGFPDNNALWSVHEENANAAAETDAGAETDYGFDENVMSPIECDENSGDDDCMDQGQDNVIIFGLPVNENREERQGTCAACKTLETDESGGSDKQEKQCVCGAKKSAEAESEFKCQLIEPEAIAKGWNADEAGNLTLGEIYLMIGKSDKLCFEYTWDKCEEDRLKEERARNLMDKLLGVARQLKKRKTNRAKTNISFVNTSSSNTFVCTKCNLKTESPVSTDGESATNAVGSSKDNCESPQNESPVRATIQQNGDSSDENKITLHADIGSSTVECSTSMASYFMSEGLAMDMDSSPISTIDNPECSSVPLDPELEMVAVSAEDLAVSSQGVVILDSIMTAVPDTTSNNASSSMCSNLPIPSSGIMEITTITPSSSNIVDRVSSTIPVTIIPTDTSLVRGSGSTADLPTMTAVPTSILTCCQTAPLAQLATTTTAVLLSEPIMFTGLAPPTEPAIPLIPVNLKPSVTTTAPPRMPATTQDTKFRRPADVPILMKPSTDDRSTNEDGSAKVNVPKPFLDLPKGNRRIGRRPAWKQRVIIPRMLPLLPKIDESMLQTATMATLITIPPVVATGLSVVPVSTENLTPVTAIPVSAADFDVIISATPVTPAVTTIGTTVTTAESTSTVNPVSAIETTASSLSTRVSTPVAGASSSLPKTGPVTGSAEKSSPTKTGLDSCLPMSSSRAGSGFEETLDNLSLSSFMDISIPESTRFIASDLRLEEFECSNSSISLSGMLEESSRKNSRDPPLLETPKKQSRPEPSRIAPLETSWSSMNEGSDLFMGGLFAGNEGLPQSSHETLSDSTDFINFQSVMGDNSLDFDDSRLSEFTAQLSDNIKRVGD